MTRSYLACAVVLAVASACNDATLPTASTGYTPNLGISDPPPPPVTGILKGGLNIPGGSSLSTPSAAASTRSDIGFRVTYNLNTTATEGQLRNFIPITANVTVLRSLLITETINGIVGSGGFKVVTGNGTWLVELNTVQGTILDPLRDGNFSFQVTAKNVTTLQSIPLTLEFTY